MKIFISGVPRPQGSKNAYKNGDRIKLIEVSKRLTAWRQSMVYDLRREAAEYLDRPVVLNLIFILPRAKTNRKPAHTQKPDLDKLIRAVGDALTQSEKITDDSYIVEIFAKKQFAQPNQETGLLLEIYEANHHTESSTK